jgi:hypothetical protein
MLEEPWVHLRIGASVSGDIVIVEEEISDMRERLEPLRASTEQEPRDN